MPRNLLLELEPDEGTGDDGAQGGDGGTTAPPAGTPAGSQDGGGTEETVSAAEFTKVQNEAKNLRKRLRALETQIAEKGNEGKSEVEQATQKLTETTERLTAAETRNRELMVAVRAPKHGIADGEVAARLIDFDELDDPSDVEEVDRALKALVKKHPFLTGRVAGGADGGAGGRGSVDEALDMNKMLRRATGRAT